MRATGGFALVAAVDPVTGNYTWACDFYNGTSWSCSSDRNQKENLRAVDGQAILERLSAMPLFTWNAIGTDPNVKHLGPTAQDFYGSFGLGDDDTMIATIDLDGVALAGVQGLYRLNQEQAAQIQALEARLARLEKSAAPGAADRREPFSGDAGWLALTGCLTALVVAQAGMFFFLSRKQRGQP